MQKRRDADCLVFCCSETICFPIRNDSQHQTRFLLLTARLVVSFMVWCCLHRAPPNCKSRIGHPILPLPVQAQGVCFCLRVVAYLAHHLAMVARVKQEEDQEETVEKLKTLCSVSAVGGASGGSSTVLDHAHAVGVRMVSAQIGHDFFWRNKFAKTFAVEVNVGCWRLVHAKSSIAL